MEAVKFTMLDATIRKTILDPRATRLAAPSIPARENVWVYRYDDTVNGWTLSIATHGEPGSKKLSLGGFRIAPLARTESPAYDNDMEAIGLAVGMEEKVMWSRLCKVGGPLAQQSLSSIVGGKCVLKPTHGARVGEPRDFELIDFGSSCLREFEETSGVFLVTGQDLGHGTMSDGETSSLSYLHKQFDGAVLADTSKPTGEGNFQALCGMLRGFDIDLAQAQIGLIGCGNIGMYLVDRLSQSGVAILALESSLEKRRNLENRSIRVCRPEEKSSFLAQPMDGLVLNANGGSLDMPTIEAACKNEKLRVICGSENLVMPDPRGSELFRQARKAFCPTELCGMMGYLTAVEEYLSAKRGSAFQIEQMYPPATRLWEVCERAIAQLYADNFSKSFEQEVVSLYS